MHFDEVTFYILSAALASLSMVVLKLAEIVP
jgi:hypothetical protein